LALDDCRRSGASIAAAKSTPAKSEPSKAGLRDHRDCAGMGTASTMACIAEDAGYGLAGFGGDTGGSFRASAGGGGHGRAALAKWCKRRSRASVITEKSVANALGC